MPQRTSAYISQYDLHIGEMTVRETLEFSARCQGVGPRYGQLFSEYKIWIINLFWSTSHMDCESNFYFLQRCWQNYQEEKRKPTSNQIPTSMFT